MALKMACYGYTPPTDRQSHGLLWAGYVDHESGYETTVRTVVLEKEYRLPVLREAVLKLLEAMANREYAWFLLQRGPKEVA